MSKVYAIDVSVMVDGQPKTLTVFTRADTKAKALKSIARVRRATVDDFLPESPRQDAEIPSTTPEPNNE